MILLLKYKKSVIRKEGKTWVREWTYLRLRTGFGMRLEYQGASKALGENQTQSGKLGGLR